MLSGLSMEGRTELGVKGYLSEKQLVGKQPCEQDAAFDLELYGWYDVDEDTQYTIFPASREHLSRAFNSFCQIQWSLAE